MMIDYTMIPEIEQRLNNLKKPGTSLLFEKFKTLELTVEINDPYLAHIMLGTVTGDYDFTLPGMTIKEIRFDDLERKNEAKLKIIDWLENKIFELKKES